MQILAQQPCSIAKVLDISFRLFAASFTKLIGYGLLLSAFYIVLTVLIANIGLDQAANDPEAVQTALAEAMPMLIGYAVILTIFSFVLYAAMIYRIDNVARQREDSFAEALGVGLKKFLPMLLAMILYGLAIFVGSLLLVVPGIILMLSLSFCPFFIVVEDMGGYASLKASHNLVWGNWWRTMTVYLAPGVIMLALYMLLVFAAVAMNGEVEPGTINPVDIISNLLSAVVMPYFYTLAYVLYHDLSLRKSGGDLAARLAK
jgi:hypothetical protein